MSIRLKTALLFIVLILFAGAGMYAATTNYFEKSFGKLEAVDSNKNTQRSIDALNNKVNQLNTKLSDWSNWDDSYIFATNKNSDFIESNLQTTSLKNLELNYILFYDTKHRLILAKGIDTSAGTERQVPSSLNAVLQPTSSLLNHQNIESLKRGFISLPEGILVFASRPILNSNAEGPIHGTLIFAQYLDAGATKELADIAHLNLQYYAINDPKLPADVRKLKDLIVKERIYTKPLNNTDVVGYGLMNDTFGKPALIARVEQPRSIHLEGQNATRFFLIAMIATAAAACLLVLLFIDRILVRRISRLSHQVEAIDNAGTSLVQVKQTGKDEIGTLEQSINTMLRGIYESRQLKEKNIELAQEVTSTTKALETERSSLEEKVQQRTAELQKLKDTLEEQVTDRTKKLNDQLADAHRINKLMVNRELKMIELKQKLKQYGENAD